jgi:hypothetical protein
MARRRTADLYTLQANLALLEMGIELKLVELSRDYLRWQQWSLLAQLLGRTLEEPTVGDHQQEGPAVDLRPTKDAGAALYVPLPGAASRSRPRERGGSRMPQHPMDVIGPYVDISRLDRLGAGSSERRLAEPEPPPSPDEQRAKRATSRYLIGRLVDAYARLWDTLATPTSIEHFVRHRVAVVIGAQDGDPTTRDASHASSTGVAFTLPAMDIEDEKVQRALALAAELGQAHAADVRQRLGAVELKPLVAAGDWWNRPEPLHRPCPTALERACQPLSEAIAERVVRRCLVAASRPLIGHVTRAGAAQAHVLVDPARWPRGFGQAPAALRQLIDAASWVSDYTWRTSGLESDRPALDDLGRRLKGGA